MYVFRALVPYVHVIRGYKTLSGNTIWSRPGLVVTTGKLSQWLYWEKNLLERSTGHMLDVSVNANSFCVQCSVMASAIFWPEIEFYIIFHAK